MAGEFVPLAILLRPAPAPPVAPAAEPPPQPAPPNAAAEPHSDQLDAALTDARLFRARLADAFEAAAARLARDLAADVLVRELRLAPCDLSALVRRVLERVPVVRVRVAAADRDGVRGVPVLVDPALEPGDAILELEGGALDARLGVRLAAVLQAFA